MRKRFCPYRHLWPLPPARVLKMVGARIMARISVIVWTSLIGTMLSFLALGTINSLPWFWR
ncbi:MAG: hypothetical protein LBS77_00895 [Desulfovibrio sp.]|nr:hypothetical protein [Desulfovibrio sp.]